MPGPEIRAKLFKMEKMAQKKRFRDDLTDFLHKQETCHKEAHRLFSRSNLLLKYLIINNLYFFFKHILQMLPNYHLRKI